MTISELKKFIEDYPDDNFVFIRIWLINENPTQGLNKDISVDKFQWGVAGQLLITGTIKL